MSTKQPALQDLILGRMLEEKAVTHRTLPFLKFSEGQLTFAQVNALAERMAKGFQAKGINQHDHVAVMLPNCADFVLVTFALAKLGAVMVPINTAYKGELLQHVLKTSEASMLVLDESFLDQGVPAVKHLDRLKCIVVRMMGSITAPANCIHKPMIPLRCLMDHGPRPSPVPVHHHHLQAVMFTSGTTGLSKGVMVPHALALTCAWDSLRFLNYAEGETIYCPCPLFHAGALWDGMMVALLMGSPIAIVERFSASRFWQDIRRFQANVAIGIFSMIPMLLNQPPSCEDKHHSLRAFYLGKSSLDEAFQRRFGVRSVETYTSTEVGIATGSPYGRWRNGSCGQPNQTTHEVKIVDEQDHEVESGRPGQLVIRPKRPFVITPGYYKDPQATADCFKNLWFHTGDLAYQDADGYVFFLDRIKDYIRRRGENISAFEVERVVNTHPSVLESAAFGVPSELEEDEVKIAVVLKAEAEPEPDALAAFCEAYLPAFMVPRYIEYVKELPRSSIGKIAKNELRRQGDHGITARTWDREGIRHRPAGITRIIKQKDKRYGLERYPKTKNVSWRGSSIHPGTLP